MYIEYGCMYVHNNIIGDHSAKGEYICTYIYIVDGIDIFPLGFAFEYIERDIYGTNIGILPTNRNLHRDTYQYIHRIENRIYF